MHCLNWKVYVLLSPFKNWGNGGAPLLRNLPDISDSELEIDWNLGLLTPKPVGNGSLLSLGENCWISIPSSSEVLHFLDFLPECCWASKFILGTSFWEALVFHKCHYFHALTFHGLQLDSSGSLVRPLGTELFTWNSFPFFPSLSELFLLLPPGQVLLLLGSLSWHSRPHSASPLIFFIEIPGVPCLLKVNWSTSPQHAGIFAYSLPWQELFVQNTTWHMANFRNCKLMKTW